MEKRSKEEKTDKDSGTAFDRPVGECKQDGIFNPRYRLREDYLDSLRCRCACAPSPGPYCG